MRISRRLVRQGALRSALGALAAVALMACGKGEEESDPRVKWSPSSTGSVVRTSTLEAGPGTPDPVARNPYAEDARAIADGRLLYEGMNCSGCHGSQGGGGIGPPFADPDWIYGSSPENIFQTVAQGRPNGMPAFGGKIPPETLWRIVAYVRSLDPTLADASAEPGGGKGTTIGRGAAGGTAR